jgi:hypothetical protein
MARKSKSADPFRWFDSSPGVIRLVVMMYVKFPLSLRKVEDRLHERGSTSTKTVRLWWTRFGGTVKPNARRRISYLLKPKIRYRSARSSLPALYLLEKLMAAARNRRRSPGKLASVHLV